MNREQHRVRLHVLRRVLVVEVNDDSESLVGMNLRNTLGDLIAERDEPVCQNSPTIRSNPPTIKSLTFTTRAEPAAVVGSDREHVRVWGFVEVSDRRFCKVLDNLRIARANLAAAFFGIVLRISLTFDLGEPLRMLFVVNIWRHDAVPVVLVPNLQRMPQSQPTAKHFIRLACGRLRELPIRTVGAVNDVHRPDRQFVL
jgi:hypothetical protein